MDEAGFEEGVVLAGWEVPKPGATWLLQPPYISRSQRADDRPGCYYYRSGSIPTPNEEVPTCFLLAR